MVASIGSGLRNLSWRNDNLQPAHEPGTRPRTADQPTGPAEGRPVVLAQYGGESSFEVAPSSPRSAPPLTGELAPGGASDPARVGDDVPGSQTLFARSNWGFPSYTESNHHYAVLSDPLPPGTTWEQANDALQRFNAPTAEAFRGVPGDPRSTWGTVALPGTSIPAGNVTFQRGDGWVTNTTTAAHPLIGSITRRIITDDQGQYRILTEGRGQGGPMGGTRHLLNITGVPGVVPGGPQIFSQMDQITIDYLRRQQQIRP
jgi:hypothetical protein